MIVIFVTLLWVVLIVTLEYIHCKQRRDERERYKREHGKL